MKPQKLDTKALNQAAIDGTISDEKNPLFIFSGLPNELLVRIAKGEFDLQDLAKYELGNRGYLVNGNWGGFNETEINREMHWDTKIGWYHDAKK